MKTISKTNKALSIANEKAIRTQQFKSIKKEIEATFLKDFNPQSFFKWVMKAIDYTDQYNRGTGTDTGETIGNLTAVQFYRLFNLSSKEKAVFAGEFTNYLLHLTVQNTKDLVKHIGAAYLWQAERYSVGKEFKNDLKELANMVNLFILAERLIDLDCRITLQKYETTKKAA